MEESCPTGLLADTPAESYAFGSHERVANHPLAIESISDGSGVEGHTT